MDCYNGCGAPLVDGECQYCGKSYQEEMGVFSLEDLVTSLSSMGQRLNAVGISIDVDEEEEEDEEEIVAMGTKGIPALPPPLTVSTYPRAFEDTQSTLGVFTVVGVLIGVFFLLIGLLPLGLLTTVFGLGCALAGGIRQHKHDKEETHD